MESQSKQEQFELFKGAAEEAKRRGFQRITPFNYTFSNINLSGDRIILLAIFCLMLAILSFSLGVEKGKRCSINAKIPIQKIVNVSQVTPATTESAPITKKVAPAPIKNSIGNGKQITDLVSDINRYTIQVASVQKQVYVSLELNKLKRLGYDTWVKPSGKYNILCVGRFSSKKEAEVIKKSLQRVYNDCFVRRI